MSISNKKRNYEQIEHTGDIGIKIYGDTFKDLLNNAALAMFDIMLESPDITAILSVTSTSSNDQIGCYVAKNGTVIDSSEGYLTTNASNRAENITVQSVIELSTNDYIEIFVENATDSSDVTVTDMNVLIKSIA